MHLQNDDVCWWHENTINAIISLCYNRLVTDSKWFLSKVKSFEKKKKVNKKEKERDNFDNYKLFVHHVDAFNR